MNSCILIFLYIVVLFIAIITELLAKTSKYLLNQTYLCLKTPSKLQDKNVKTSTPKPALSNLV